MNRNEYKVDRSRWPAGPWDDEPEDRMEWRHAGHPCLLVRNRMGAWCGYVGVQPGHPAHGKDYLEVDEGLAVHGGLTYAAPCQPDGGPVCHTPNPGEPDDVWWLGFDCAHSGDIVPSLAAMPSHGQPWTESYRSIGYAKAETESLAEQLAR